MEEPSTLTVDIERAILSASNPDLSYRERKEIKRKLRYYITHPNMPKSIVERCQTALNQVLDTKPFFDRCIDQFLLPLLAALVAAILWFYILPTL